MLMIDFAVVMATAAVSVALGLAYVGRQSARPSIPVQEPTEGLHFLFHGCDLHHATADAANLLPGLTDRTDWDALRDTIAKRFPDFPRSDDMEEITHETHMAADSGDHGVLHLSRFDDMIRVTIHDIGPDFAHMSEVVRSLQREKAMLTGAADTAPYPIWMARGDGTPIWANAAYTALDRDRKDRDTPLFSAADLDAAQDGPVKIQLNPASAADPRWFNVTARMQDDLLIGHAVDISAVVVAEAAQRKFVQTLAKTFAQLSIGLAIFDRNGQLALFNPALVDLTSLPTDFLSARPDLLSFFDRLRDNRVMPEPKNYGTWRQEIAEVITAANHGRYEETWSLDSGATYRVTGRPHPDGAVAFLIEDITAEISLTRNFRAELELGQAVLDAIEDPLAVFSPTGTLTFCNEAYREVWKLDPDSSFAEVTIIDTLAHWQSECAPDPAWSDIRDFVFKLGDRAPWDARVQHETYGAMQLIVAPLVSGATMVRFTAPVTQDSPSERAAG